ERRGAAPAELAGQLRPRRLRGRMNLAEPAKDEGRGRVELAEQAALAELAAGPQKLQPGAGVAEGEKRPVVGRRAERLAQRGVGRRLRALVRLRHDRAPVRDPPRAR